MASVEWQSITGSGSGTESLAESSGRVLGHEESGAKPFEADDVLILTSSSKSFRLASNVQPLFGAFYAVDSVVATRGFG